MFKKLNKSIQKPFYYEYKGSSTIVLFIHGFLEGPAQFMDLASICLDNKISAAAVLLPGHGGTSSEFAGSSLFKWINYIDMLINNLRKKYKRIILAGHSMGTLLAINSYSNNKIGIHGLILIATPLKIRLTLRGFRCGLNIAIKNIKSTDLYTCSMYEATSIDQPVFFGYLSWIPRYIDLFRLIKYIRKNKLLSIDTDTLIVHSYHDEFVRYKSVKILKNKLNKASVRVVNLFGSGHFHYIPEDKELLSREFTAFILAITKEA